MTQTPNEQKPESTDEIRTKLQTINSGRWANIASLYEAGEFAVEPEKILRDINKLINDKPDKSSAKYLLLNLIADGKIKDQKISSENYPTTSIITILTEGLYDKDDPDFQEKVKATIHTLGTNYMPKANRRVYFDLLDYRERKATAVTENQATNSRSVNEAIKYAKEMSDLNWQPTGITKKQVEDFQAAMGEINKKYKRVEEIRNIYDQVEIDSPEEQALDHELDQLEKEVAELESKTNNEIMPTFKNEFNTLLNFQDAYRQTGVDFLKVKKLKTQDGGEIEIKDVHRNKNNEIVIQYIDENFLLQERGIKAFIKGVIEGKGAFQEINTIHELNASLNLSEDPIKPQDIFVENSWAYKKDPDAKGAFEKFIVKNVDDSVENGKIQIEFEDKDGKKTDKEFNFGQFASYAMRGVFKKENSQKSTEDKGDKQDKDNLEKSDTNNREISKIINDIKEKFVLPTYQEALEIGQVESNTVNPKYLKTLYANTYFYSVNNIVQFFKEIWEQIKKNWELADDFRVGKLGEELFGGFPSFKEHFKYNKRKAAQKQMTENVKGELESKEPSKWISLIRTSDDTNVLEACFELLSENGLLDLWDLEMWKNISRHPNHDKTIPIPTNLNPQTIISEENPYPGYVILEQAIDMMFDPGVFKKWERANDSNCSQKVKSSYDSAATLNNSPGGLTGRLTTLLEDHKKGVAVDPHEYEGIIGYMIENQKGSLDDKIYYIIKGFTEEKDGEPIISFRRMTQMSKELGGKFPPLLLLTASVPRPPSYKESHPFTLKEFKHYSSQFDQGGGDKNKPGKAVGSFIWNIIISNPLFADIASSMVRDLSTLNGDEALYYFPLTTRNTIESSCNITTGQKLDTKAFAKGFGGYSQYLKTLLTDGKEKNIDRIKESIKSYVHYWAIMTKKWDPPGAGRLQRLDDTHYNKKLFDSDKSAKDYAKELTDTLTKIANAYAKAGDNTLLETIKTMEGTGSSQKERQNALDQFEIVFEKVLSSDGGNIMFENLDASDLMGIPSK